MTNAEYIAKAAEAYQRERWEHGSFADQEEPFLAGAKAQLQGPQVKALVEALELYASAWTDKSEANELIAAFRESLK